ncbi:MAG: hypothetical protein ACPIOQ_31370 [Promethearchaeia archaeon]
MVDLIACLAPKALVRLTGQPFRLFPGESRHYEDNKEALTTAKESIVCGVLA